MYNMLRNLNNTNIYGLSISHLKFFDQYVCSKTSVVCYISSEYRMEVIDISFSSLEIAFSENDEK